MSTFMRTERNFFYIAIYTKKLNVMAVEYNFDFEELNYNLYFFFNSSEDF
jgi:hypothetical protein